MHSLLNNNLNELIESLITQAHLSEEQPEYQSAGLWWKKCWQKENLLPQSNLHQLVVLAFQAPNFSCAFVVAYQIALRRMFPQLPLHANLACLCVSEKAGNSPKAIECAIKEQKINGEKTFVTCTAELDTLLIMVDDQDASISLDQNKTPISSSKNSLTKTLKLLQINHVSTVKSRSLHLSLSPFNADKFLPDIGKGNLLLNNFPIEQVDELKGDAHPTYSKPFSVLEGLCIRLAMCAHLLKWACVYHWPTSLQADLILQIFALENTLQNSAHSATTQIVIDAQNRLLEKLIPLIDELAEKQPLFKVHWQRDKIALFMDFRLKEKRLNEAWIQLHTQHNTL